ncbi:hypothetical protein [Flavobacterium sp. 3HN19-14]|uniref:hypothetical protein n=1 Tax=Flavobacterium sp. 3HN19-14 TaxID=3448133 RepID=UPI003EE18429
MTAFTISGSDALAIVLKSYPENWETKIAEATADIKAYMRLWKLDSVDAINKALRTGITPENETSCLRPLTS